MPDPVAAREAIMMNLGAVNVELILGLKIIFKCRADSGPENYLGGTVDVLSGLPATLAGVA